ncbi:MAG: hypothetical protein KC635_09840 [Myxococcales bacterium]|nr:hypothetical protein [Myxococcales bacterium]MCB9733161.1 hypothetical protein [Deltaproteobacteria bacterium]
MPVTPPSEERLIAIFNAVEPYIEDRYGVPVIIKDVTNPFTGDLDGAEIHVDYEVSWEDAVFIVAHLFGHTVQWNTDPEARRVGLRTYAGATDDELAELVRYEKEAVCYSLQLFHDAGVHDIDGWLAEFAACDLDYLVHFYRTGEKPPFRSFWPTGPVEAIAPKPIPEFTTTRWFSRWEGVVI